MKAVIKRFVRFTVPEGVLTGKEIDDVAAGIIRLMERAPFYVRPAFEAFFAVRFTSWRPELTLEALRTGIGTRKMKRAKSMLYKGVATLIYGVIFSHPTVLAHLGIEEGRCFRLPQGDDNLPDIASATPLRELRSDRHEADWIVIGSGPGGSMAAHRLAEAGHSVIVCEKGRRHDDTEKLTVVETAIRYYGAGGFQAALGEGPMAVPILIGEMLGGSAAVNMATSLVPERRVIESWGMSWKEMRLHYEAVSHLIGVRDADPEIMGLQNDVMMRGCEALGFGTELIPRAALNRCGAATCMTAGRNAYKLSPERALLPRAVRNGARVISECPVYEFVRDGYRITGVLAGTKERSVHFSARKGVILSAGPVGTPMLLQANGFNEDKVGQASFFQVNSTVLGLMPEAVNSWVGTEQAVISRNFQEIGIVLEGVSSPLPLIAPYLPGHGKSLWREARNFSHMAQVGFIVDCDRTPLKLKRRRGEPFMTFRLNSEDGELIRLGFQRAMEVLFAAKADSVILPGVYGWMGPGDAQKKLDRIDPVDLGVVSVHLIGTCPMGEHPRDSVVDMGGKMRGVDGLWVMDGSVIPTSLGVNPQLTIMALTSRNASNLA